MSPNRREREYAKRRYEDWQRRQAGRRARRQRILRRVVAGGSAVAVVAAVGLAAWLTRDSGTSSSATAASTPTPSASSPSGPATTSGDSGQPGPCPVPTVKPAPSPSSWPTPPPPADAKGKTFALTLKTTCGAITLTLDGSRAPQAVASTIFLAQKGFYDGTPCHRLTTQGIFVLQCGDPTGTGSGGPGYSYGPVENAPADNVYPAGTVAMARQGGNGSSMGSQFFLVYQDSTIPSDAAGGYTVMGSVTGGLDVLKTIADGGVAGGGGDGAPTRAVSIESTTVAPG